MNLLKCPALGDLVTDEVIVPRDVVTTVEMVLEETASDLNVGIVERLHTARTVLEKERKHAKPGIKPAIIATSSTTFQPYADLQSLLLLTP